MGPDSYGHHVIHLHQHSGVAELKVLYALICLPNITPLTIYQILGLCYDHTEWLTGNGDMLQSEEWSSLIVKNPSSRYTSLDIQPMKSS